MRVLCVFGQHNYGNPTRGESYEYSNFVPTLRRLGHEVLFFESYNRSTYKDFRELNETLLLTVERERPDVVLSVLVHYEIWLETWEILRDSGIAATINWATDDSWRYQEFSRLVAPAFHAFATTYPTAYARYLRDGFSHVLLTQWGANAVTLQPPIPAARCRYAVSFVGTAHSDRRAWITALDQAGIKVDCFGYGWPSGPVAAAEIPQIIRSSVISLNFAKGGLTWNGIFPRRLNQIKARTFEIPGAGGFLLTEWADDLSKYYTPGEEVCVFRDLTDLADSIHYYLAHPLERDTIAFKGHARTLAEHTYEHRLVDVLAFAVRQRDEFVSRHPGLPIGRVDWARFEDASRQHKMNRSLRLLRHALEKVCIAAWGPTRGPRAARRAVFELSWRLAGAKCYSASGWPGRMFYEAS